MIAHVVLFRPRADLTADQRATFLAALQYALTNIPLIKRARVGRRVTLGRLYDQQNIEQYPYIAIMEFEHETALREYLNHLAHETLGTEFYKTAEAALVFDYELIAADQIAELLA